MEIYRSSKFFEFTFVLTAEVFFTAFIGEPNIYIIESLIVRDKENILVETIFEDIRELFIVELMQEVLSFDFVIVVNEIHLASNKGEEDDHYHRKFRGT